MFRDRADAGNKLAARLAGRPLTRPLILAIPRGGLIPAAVIAKQINAELDVILVRKLRAPDQPELALGAVSEDGFMVLGAPEEHLHRVVNGHLAEERRHQLGELARHQQQIRGLCRQAPISGRSVIVVDDGMITGSSMVAALQAVRAQHPLELIAAVPVAPADRVSFVRESCDDLIVLETSPEFRDARRWYEDFGEVTDEQVLQLLRDYGCQPAAIAGQSHRGP